MTQKQVEEEIDNLLQTLQTWEDIDPAYMDEDLKDLRHKVMHVHLRIESSLEILIGDFLLRPFLDLLDLKKPKDQIRHIAFRQNLDLIFNEMDYLKKADLAMKLGKINGKAHSKLAEVNSLRKYFSHPKSYIDKINTYKDRNKYLSALKILVKAYKELDEIFSEKVS